MLFHYAQNFIRLLYSQWPYGFVYLEFDVTANRKCTDWTLDTQNCFAVMIFNGKTGIAK